MKAILFNNFDKDYNCIQGYSLSKLLKKWPSSNLKKVKKEF